MGFIVNVMHLSQCAQRTRMALSFIATISAQRCCGRAVHALCLWSFKMSEVLGAQQIAVIVIFGSPKKTLRLGI